jgi:hypothetical protein
MYYSGTNVVYRHDGEPNRADPWPCHVYNLRLDLNSTKTDVGRPLVKMSTYWDVIGT